MEHMPFVQVFDVFAGDEVHLLVPVAVELIQLLKPLQLGIVETGKIFSD
jgi:hypothetical protein